MKSYNNYIKRIKNETLPCYEPSIGNEEIAVLKKVINSGWLSENKYTRIFEKKIAKYSQRKFSLAFNNATAAMITGMKALNLGKNHEVIVPTFTHSADVNAISAVGANPVFADVDKNTLCLSLATIKKVLTKKTKAILFVALYGNSGEIKKISEFCKKKNLFLICDCAAALGSLFEKRQLSSYGIFSVLSFFCDKTITTGEGGMLLTDNKKFLEECNIYKNDGRKERGVDLIERKGFNFRITEMQSAIGTVQIKKLNKFILKKKKIYKIYSNNLNNIFSVKIFRFDISKIVPHRIVIFAEKARLLLKYLVKFGIGARTTFMPMHTQPCYKFKGKFPVSEQLYKSGICLPSAPSLKKKDINFISNKIKKFYNSNDN
jgi:perosamine synthetase